MSKISEIKSTIPSYNTRHDIMIQPGLFTCLDQEALRKRIIPLDNCSYTLLSLQQIYIEDIKKKIFSIANY